MNVTKKQSGFTIIEVVLVLAIAGLIFLMVFIALPALQRSQRDSQREQDMSRVLTAVQSYQSNNRNSIPANTNSAWNTLRDSYLKAGGDDFTDPSGKAYTFSALTANANVPTTIDATSADQANSRVFFTVGATCGTGGAVQGGQGNRKVAIRIVLEGGGVYCTNN